MTAHSPSFQSTLGLVFTDARGRVVFGDSGFLELVGPRRAANMIGESLHKILGSAPDVLTRIIKQAGSAGAVRAETLSIVDASGEQAQVRCSGAATFDNSGTFIGVDLTFHPLWENRDEVAAPVTHSDILSARIQQIEAEADSHAAAESLAWANLYFISQIAALQVLLGRMGGPRIGAAVEGIVNDLAERSNWLIHVTNGQFVVGIEHTPLDAYRAVLAEVVSYGDEIVGRQAVRDEMRMVDERMKAEILQAAEKAGLRIM